jgi:DNA-directed RNA polymerase specialized sigma24 family protein
MAASNAERQRRWRGRQPKYPRIEKPVTAVHTPASKKIEAPGAPLVAAFDREWPRFSNYAKSHVWSGVKLDAQDLASEVRARFLEQGGKVRSPKNVKAWMYRVLKNLLADRGRETDKNDLLNDGLRAEIKEELAESGLYIGHSRTGSIERDERDVVKSRDETNASDGESIFRTRNPYHSPDDDDDRPEIDILRPPKGVDPLAVGRQILSRDDHPLPRNGPAVDPGERFVKIQNEALRAKRTTATWTRP